LKRVARSELAVEHLPKRPGEQQRSVVSIAKAGSLLGWRPRHSLEEGLSRTFSFFAERHGKSTPEVRTAGAEETGARR
jgi:nucleoside-diphosphate-sugar epimerase